MKSIIKFAKASLLSVPLVAATLHSASAGAAVVIDQEVIDGGSYSIQYAQPSQSFTANADTLASINVNISNQYFGSLSQEDAQDTTLWMVLYQGGNGNINDADNELAQTSADAASVLGAGPFSRAMVPFSFEGISLTVGQTYTFQLFDFGYRYGVNFSNSNPYADGAALMADGNPNYDLSFQVTSVPEPAPAMLLAPALMAMLARAGLRRKSVRAARQI